MRDAVGMVVSVKVLLVGVMMLHTLYVLIVNL
jgi:hypothetical protein